MTRQWIAAAALLVGLAPATAQEAPIVGRWDLTVHGSDGDYPAWLEVRRSGYRTLVGSYVPADSSDGRK